MISKISEGVQISVETFYEADFSNIVLNEHTFSYKITIQNDNAFPIKLKRRHWYIFDSNGTLSEVEGEGVVGAQPTLNQGCTYQYASACNLQSEMGTMHGTYTFENLYNQNMFLVTIPKFSMIVPFKNN
ncbi:MAG: Co2+/Mg2+ efflux protein ApaG [Ferruginibacter sp.]|nr:Co2+/Mg2+ efflux protein ApaG [Ferruginibacter sp.]